MKLNLEMLNGPLDGYVVTLETEANWGKEGKGPLIFPWDAQLGIPQARFFPEAGKWWIEGYDAPQGTYCLNHQRRIQKKMQLETGDLLKASDTWLVVNMME